MVINAETFFSFGHLNSQVYNVTPKFDSYIAIIFKFLWEGFGISLILLV